MKHVICPICGNICIKHGKTTSGSQRWFCKNCKIAFTPKLDNSAKQLQIFLNWLFSKDSQKDMPGEGRSFRRHTSRFWDIWPLPPKVEVKRDVLYVDGIYDTAGSTNAMVGDAWKFGWWNYSDTAQMSASWFLPNGGYHGYEIGGAIVEWGVEDGTVGWRLSSNSTYLSYDTHIGPSGRNSVVYNNYNERLTDDNVLIDDMKLAYTVLKPFGSVDVTGISLSNTTPAVGDELKINVAVKNTGLTKADSYTLSLYADTETGKTEIGTLSGKKLYAGWSQTHEFTWTVPENFEGVRFVAKATESGYDGQCGSCSSETLEYKPVFEVHNVGAAQEKDGFVVTAQITNQGNAPTLETDKVMLRLCGPYDLAFNIPSEECVLGTTVLPELQPGETQSVSVAVHADADLFERFGYVECLVGVSRDDETLEDSTVSKMLYPVSPLLTLLNGEAIPQEITLRKGGSQALSTTYQPVIFNGFTTVSFITDDPSVAKVENGRLKAVSEGTTVLHGLMLQSGMELPDIEITVTDTISDNTDDNTKDSYAIELSSDIKNGKVEVSPKNAFDGQPVTITVTPDKGYTLETITVLDQNGKEVEVKSLGNNKYSFKMPNETVSVEVVFAPLQSYATCLGDDTCPMNKFTDVNVNAWYHPGVHYCLDNGIMAGFPNDLFKPDGITTRAQIAQILYNLEGQPAFMNDNVFTDVASGSWYDKAVVWAQGKGVVSGYPDGTFKPDDSITREQLAVILYSYAKYKGIDVTVDENTNFLSFNDFWDTSEWAKPAMMWAIDRELIVGSNWDLKPQGDAVRAQAATIICKFCENVAK